MEIKCRGQRQARARSRARAHTMKSIGNSRLAATWELFVCSAPAKAESARNQARALCARALVCFCACGRSCAGGNARVFSLLFSSLAVVGRGKRSHFFVCSLFVGVRSQGETLAFFPLFSLRWRPWGRGNARIFSRLFSSLAVVGRGKRSHFSVCSLFVGVRSQGETLAFFALFSLRWRRRGRGNARIFSAASSSRLSVRRGKRSHFFVCFLFVGVARSLGDCVQKISLRASRGSV